MTIIIIVDNIAENTLPQHLLGLSFINIFLENEINRYKSLGFNIEDVVDTPFYEVTFPNGWGFGGYEIFYGTPIHDEQNRLRGWISFSTQHMGLYTGIKHKNHLTYL